MACDGCLIKSLYLYTIISACSESLSNITKTIIQLILNNFNIVNDWDVLEDHVGAVHLGFVWWNCVTPALHAGVLGPRPGAVRLV